MILSKKKKYIYIYKKVYISFFLIILSLFEFAYLFAFRRLSLSKDVFFSIKNSTHLKSWRR